MSKLTDQELEAAEKLADEFCYPYDLGYKYIYKAGFTAATLRMRGEVERVTDATFDINRRWAAEMYGIEKQLTQARAEALAHLALIAGQAEEIERLKTSRARKVEDVIDLTDQLTKEREANKVLTEALDYIAKVRCAWQLSQKTASEALEKVGGLK